MKRILITAAALMILVPARIDAQGNAGELKLSVKEAQ